MVRGIRLFGGRGWAVGGSAVIAVLPEKTSRHSSRVVKIRIFRRLLTKSAFTHLRTRTTRIFNRRTSDLFKNDPYTSMD